MTTNEIYPLTHGGEIPIQLSDYPNLVHIKWRFEWGEERESGVEMEPSVVLGEKDYLACCGSVRFAEEMVLAGPFSDYQRTVNAARDIWFNKVCPSPSLSLYLHWWLCIYVWVFLLGEWICFQVDVNGWLEAFAAHPQIGESPSRTHKSPTSTQFSFLPLSNIFFSLVVNFLGGLGCGWETLWARLISRFWFQHFWLNDPDQAPSSWLN